MSEFMVHEINCEEGTAVYRAATPEESLNISFRPEPSLADNKFRELREAAKQAAPELYEFVCYAIGVNDDDSE